MLQLEEEEGSTEKRELKKGVNLRVERGVSQGVESAPERGAEKRELRGVEEDKYIINSLVIIYAEKKSKRR